MRRKRKEGDTCLTSFAKGQCLVWAFAICCHSTPATFCHLLFDTTRMRHLRDGLFDLLEHGSKAGRHMDLGYPYSSFLILVSLHRREDDFLMYGFGEVRF